MAISAPLPSSWGIGQRPIADTPYMDTPPTTLREFLRWVKARDPRRYLEVLKKYPVNQHIFRDERSHELLTDFREGQSTARLKHDNELDAVAKRVVRDQYLAWMAEEWT